MTSVLTKYLVAVLAALALAVAGVAYRSHLIDTGHDAGVAEQRAVEQTARVKAEADDRTLSQNTEAAHKAADAALKAQHENTVRNLSVALAASDHRNQLLSGRIASLLDQAAGVSAGPSADPGQPGATPDPAEADSTVEALIQTTADNYAICRANAQTLVDLQNWYLRLRAGDGGAGSAGVAPAASVRSPE